MGSLKDIVSYLPVVITTVMVVITAATNVLNRRDRPRKILKWLKPIFARIQSVDQLSGLPNERDIGKQNLQPQFSCEIHFRNSGNTPITKQPVLIEFDPGTNILNAKWQTVPEREFGAVDEDMKSRSQSQRRYRIALMNPDDCVTFRFLVGDPEYVRIFAKSEGVETNGPECTYVNEPQTEIGSKVLSNRLKNLIVTPSIIIAALLFEIPFVRVIIAVALILAGVTFSQQAQSGGLPVNPSLTVPVWTIIVVLGWLVFQFGVSSGSWREFRSSRLIEDKTGKTSFGLFMTAANSTITTLVGGGVLVIIALSVTGHGDVAVQILQLILGKIVRMIQAIFE